MHLSARAPLSEIEIHRLTNQILSNKLGRSNLSASGLHEFLTVTRGNPLLVELGLEWLVTGKPFSQMSEDFLLEDRSRRFLQALKTAGFETGQGQLIDMLAMATIAGGAPTTLPDKEKTIWDIFGVQRIDASNTARLFPTETDIDLSGYIPPIRPQTMAIAFARAVLIDLASVDRRRVIRTAWQANPRGTLRTLLRIDGGYKFRMNEEDPLQAAFLAVPVESGIAPLDLFRLLAEASCSATANDWEDRKYHIGAGLLENTLSVIDTLSNNELKQALTFVVDLILADRTKRMLRENNCAYLLMNILRTLDRGGQLLEPQVLTAIGRWAASPRAECHECIHDWDWGSPAKAGIAPETGTTAKVLSWAIAAPNISVRILLYRLMGHAACNEKDLPSSDIWRECAAFMVEAETAVQARRDSACQALHPRFLSLSELVLPCSTLSLSVRTSFASLLATSDPKLCRQIADEVDAIAERFPDHETIQLARVNAWQHVTLAAMSDPALCRQMAERVDAIAERFPDHETIQLTRVNAWQHVAHATRRNVSTTLRQWPLEFRLGFLRLVLVD